MPRIKPSPDARKYFQLLVSEIFLDDLQFYAEEQQRILGDTNSAHWRGALSVVRSEDDLKDLLIALHAIEAYRRNPLRKMKHAAWRREALQIKENVKRHLKSEWMLTDSYVEKYRKHEAYSDDGLERLKTLIMLGFGVEQPSIQGRHPSMKLWRRLADIILAYRLEKAPKEAPLNYPENEFIYWRLKERFRQLTSKRPTKRPSQGRYATVLPDKLTKAEILHIAEHIYSAIRARIAKTKAGNS